MALIVTILFQFVDENGNGSSISFNRQKDPAKPKYWVDRESKKLHNDRINNGLMLFAEYYFSLWD